MRLPLMIHTRQIKCPYEEGVKQRGSQSPKRFALIFFKNVEKLWKGNNVSGEFLSHLRYASDIIIGSNLQQLEEKVRVGNRTNEKVDICV